MKPWRQWRRLLFGGVVASIPEDDRSLQSIQRGDKPHHHGRRRRLLRQLLMGTNEPKAPDDDSCGPTDSNFGITGMSVGFGGGSISGQRVQVQCLNGYVEERKKRRAITYM
jgi:hypothetical protein